MPAQLQAAARYVLDQPHDVALLSMREQARQAGVQPVHDDAASPSASASKATTPSASSTPKPSAAAGWAFPARRARRSRARSCAATARSRPRCSPRSTAPGRRISPSRPRSTRSAEAADADRLGRAASTASACAPAIAVAWHLHYILSLIGEQRRAARCVSPASGRDPIRAAPAEGRAVRRRASRPIRAPRSRPAQYARLHAACRSSRITDSAVSPLAQIADHADPRPDREPVFLPQR